METIHVVPINDLKPHSTEDNECWCMPRVEAQADGCLVVHNSADGREILERAVDHSFSDEGRN